SKIHVDFHGQTPATITAARGVITKTPRALQLEHPRVDSGSRRSTADKATLFLRPDNTVDRVLAEGNVQADSPGPDGLHAGGRHVNRAETLGANPQIAIRPASSTAGQQTLVTADKFNARFDAAGRLASVHGARNARITTTTPGQPDRVTTSATLDATFRAGKGIEAIVQQGGFVYTDGDRKAWADSARYTPVDQIIVLS